MHIKCIIAIRGGREHRQEFNHSDSDVRCMQTAVEGLMPLVWIMYQVVGLGWGDGRHSAG